MQELSISTLVDMTIGLAQGKNDQERFDKLLDAIRKTIQCDCIALMSLQNGILTPLAMQGLTKDTMGRRFKVSDHPRFEQICQSARAIRFDSDSPLPDPFDGLLIDHDGDLPMHACMGIPLIFGDSLLGVLTLDSLMPNVFDNISPRSLEALSALAASTLKMALTVSKLELKAQQSEQRIEELNTEAWERDGSNMIGSSEIMQSLNTDIQVVAPSHFNILILGETGVGKELVARSIHHQSDRKKQPLIYVNCAAIPENLVESELFGHKKGAFTGADASRLGKFALANGGTLFLDEIGELPLSAQSKILRALQSNEIQPVGQNHVEVIDVRVLAATNRDLAVEVKEGRFRADLFHRLSVYPLTVPPLRQREGDVTILAGFFLEQARRKLGIRNIKWEAEALDTLSIYQWPGNVRELEHVVNRAALKARAKFGSNAIVSVGKNDLALLDVQTGSSESQTTQSTGADEVNTVTLKQATDAFQRKTVINALESADFNWAKAARKLSVDRANLIRLAKRLGIQVTKKHRIE
ncbi:nitric oxide reductase transcriptional regulator NorR [Vibrio mexicanus]|uniref:nitric oxide reductase transcriptional regulator NorR n=1 Tax=Vibrio mexicanus TaxID=1004326 RepID=UPI00063CBAFD|nr:nitric oxide reductase transcriptional regulator NorR [Vibrio mexicanus]